MDGSFATQPSTGMTEGVSVVTSGKPEAFSVADFCRLAEAHAVGSAEFNDLMDLAGRLYPDSPVACINAAGVALLRRDTERARNICNALPPCLKPGVTWVFFACLKVTGERRKST